MARLEPSLFEALVTASFPLEKNQNGGLGVANRPPETKWRETKVTVTFADRRCQAVRGSRPVRERSWREQCCSSCECKQTSINDKTTLNSNVSLFNEAWMAMAGHGARGLVRWLATELPACYDHVRERSRAFGRTAKAFKYVLNKQKHCLA